MAIWILIGISFLFKGLIIKKTDKAESNLRQLVSCLEQGFPLYIGILLLFFGLFLIGLDKIIETMVESFLGVLIIIYGMGRLKGQKVQDLLLVALVIIGFSLTLGYIFFI